MNNQIGGESNQTGNAGEYYVVAELLKLGFIAGLTPRGTVGFDVLLQVGTGASMLRVKTKRGNVDGWRWSAKKDGTIFPNLRAEGDFTVLVDMADDRQHMGFYIVPTQWLNNTLKAGHQRWLDTPGKDGQPHADTSLRKLNLRPHRAILAGFSEDWSALA